MRENSYVPFDQFSAVVTGTTGATYSFDLQVSNSEGTSPLSAPVSFTLAGTLPPKLTLNTSSSNPGTVTWNMPNGVTSGTVSFYCMERQNGQNVPVFVGTADLASGTNTFSELPSGPNTIFAVYSGLGEGINGLIRGYSPYSNMLQIKDTGGAPRAPAWIVAKVAVGPGDQEQVNLSWQNTPNNEDSYQLQRSVNGGAFENLGSTKQDWTATADRNVIPGDAYSYRVEALNSAGPSGWSPSTYTPVPPGVICLLSGDDTGNPIVDQAHQSVGAGYIINSKFNCVAAYSFGAEGYFSLAWFGYSPTWLGFNSTIWPGYRVEGKIYDTDKFGKVVSSKVVTPQQEASWLSYMAARDKTPGVYDLAYHNCRTYSQWEYNAAPGNH